MTEDNGRGRVFKSSSVAVAVNNKVESWRKKENFLFFRTATNINNNEEIVWMQKMQNTKQAEEKVKYYLDDDLMTIEIMKLGHQQMHKGVSLESKLTEAEVTDLDSLPTKFVHNKQEHASPQQSPSPEYNRANNFNSDSITLDNRQIYEEDSTIAPTRKFPHLCSINCFILSLLFIIITGCVVAVLVECFPERNKMKDEFEEVPSNQFTTEKLSIETDTETFTEANISESLFVEMV